MLSAMLIGIKFHTGRSALHSFSVIVVAVGVRVSISVFTTILLLLLRLLLLLLVLLPLNSSSLGTKIKQATTQESVAYFFVQVLQETGLGNFSS